MCLCTLLAIWLMTDALDVAGRVCLHRVFLSHNLVAASAAGGIPCLSAVFEQRFLTVGSCPGRQPHSCCQNVYVGQFPPWHYLSWLHV
jgi:hypothetical protein